MSTNEPKKRLKAAESRRALLDAGLELLKARGVAPGLDRVTLKDAIEMSGVPRSTAYRLYEGGEGQLEAFRSDLLADLDNSTDATTTFEASANVLEEYTEYINSRDPILLATAMREIMRVAVQANVDAHVDNVEWRVYMSSLASAGTGGDIASEVAEPYKVAPTDFGDRFVPLYQELARMFGLRTREPMTMEQFGAVMAATTEGVALRQHLDPRLSNVKRATGPDGALQTWNAAAIAFEALVLAWFEPDPAADVSADLSGWTAFC